MKNKILMSVFALLCLGVGLLSGGCAAPQGSQRYEPSPLVGGAAKFPERNPSGWAHPGVMP
jgi:hypothetical protein